MAIYGLIPARGGSRRAPGKNVADLAGRPLVAWTIDCAFEADVFASVTVSTNDEAVARIAGARGCQVIERSPEIARDDTPMLPVVLDALACLRAAGDDLIVLLQPTSPFRSPQDILDAVSVAQQTRGDSVVSVVRHAEGALFLARPSLRLRPAQDGLAPVGDPVVSNGAVYVATAASLERGGDFYNGAAYGHLMPKIRSVDVDEVFELEVARFMARTMAAEIGFHERV